MKAQCALVVIIVLAGSVFHVQASDVGMYDPSAALTLDKGNELLKKGEYEKARQYDDAAIARDPKEWPSYFDRASVFIYQQKWNLALQDLNTVLRLKLTFYLPVIMRARINQHLGKVSSSLADYDTVLKWNSGGGTICALFYPLRSSTSR